MQLTMFVTPSNARAAWLPPDTATVTPCNPGGSMPCHAVLFILRYCSCFTRVISAVYAIHLSQCTLCSRLEDWAYPWWTANLSNSLQTIGIEIGCSCFAVWSFQLSLVLRHSIQSLANPIHLNLGGICMPDVKVLTPDMISTLTCSAWLTIYVFASFTLCWDFDYIAIRKYSTYSEVSSEASQIPWYHNRYRSQGTSAVDWGCRYACAICLAAYEYLTGCRKGSIAKGSRWWGNLHAKRNLSILVLFARFCNLSEPWPLWG